VVTEIGPAVTGIAVGDWVMGLFPAAGSARWRSPTTAGSPGCRLSWTFHQAAVIPVVFLTAYYGLVDLAAVFGAASPC